MILPQSDARQLYVGDVLGRFQQAFPADTEQDGSGGTNEDLKIEWHNPSVVVGTVLMVVGSKAVQDALAQASGALFTPVCFSFGWVSYALSTLVGVFGDGRLLPPPDYGVKVFNLDSGYYRNNRNWVIGRIVRDHEALMSSQEDAKTKAIRISIFDAERNNNGAHKFAYNTLHIWGAVVILVQLAIASIPAAISQGREWGPLALTALGTVLALMVGALPQWAAEKLPKRSASKATYALTAGNGSRDIMVIKGQGNCIDLEELAISESPRNGYPWTKFPAFSSVQKHSSQPRAKETGGVPIGFLMTCVVTTVSAVLWLLVMISVAGLDEHTWALILVGFVGTIHNTLLGGMARDPKHRNLPLNLIDTITASKVMDGLMDLEVTHPESAHALLTEFFPGEIRPNEKDWWKTKGDRSLTDYDRQRLKDAKNKTTFPPRSLPRSAMPHYKLHSSTTGGPPTSITTAEHPPVVLRSRPSNDGLSRPVIVDPQNDIRDLDEPINDPNRLVSDAAGVALQEQDEQDLRAESAQKPQSTNPEPNAPGTATSTLSPSIEDSSGGDYERINRNAPGTAGLSGSLTDSKESTKRLGWREMSKDFSKRPDWD
ncbi:hypothetical protein SCUP234_11053 [Seiridium cupressi]